MEYMNKLIQAMENEEMISFLRGDNFYKIETSQYAPGAEPTDVGKVLSKAIYKIYKKTPKVKEEFERALISMLDGTLFDIYVVTLYIMSQLFKENNNLSPFKLNFEVIIPKLKEKLKTNKEEFQSGIKYPDGFEKKDIWNEIERFDKVCKAEYHITLLD